MSLCVMCKTSLTWENKTLCVKCGTEICDSCSQINKYKCEKCSDKAKIKIPDIIRRSSIEDYKSCPFYFKLHVIDGHEPKQHVLARLGSDLHDLYEQLQRKEIEMFDISNHCNDILQKIEKDYPEEDMTRIKEKIETCNNNFLELLPKLTNKPISYEERIYFPIADNLPKVTIAYDRLEEDENGDLHIVDWKTGKVMSGKKLTTDLQPALYLKAVEHQYGKMPKSFKLIYLGDVDKNGKYKERTFTSIDDNKFVCKVGKKEYIQDITEQLKIVQKLFSQIKAGKFSIPTKPDYFKCKMCHFKKEGLCNGNDVQNWININEERTKYGW